MGTVAEGVTWATHETDLKTHLGVTGTSEDVALQRWLSAAVTQADQFLDTDLDDPLHDDIATGVFEWVRLKRTAVRQPNPSGLKSLKVGAVAYEYAQGADAKPGDLAITEAVTDLWWPFKGEIVP